MGQFAMLVHFKILFITVMANAEFSASLLHTRDAWYIKIRFKLANISDFKYKQLSVIHVPVF